jgi:hypothetical protein
MSSRSAKALVSGEHYCSRRFLTWVSLSLSTSFARLANLKLLGLILLFTHILVFAAPAFPPEQASKHLPAVLGDFKATSAAIPVDEISEVKIRTFGAISAATRSYKSKSGDTVFVSLVITNSDSTAYSLLTDWGCTGGIGTQEVTLPELAGRSCVSPTRVQFAKGPVYAQVETNKGEPVSSDSPKKIATVLAQSLDNGEGDLPALIKHFPDWENVQHRILLAVSLETLKRDLSDPPVLDVVSFEGGAQAAIGKYDEKQLVVVEFNTPQLATDNDQRITAKIGELKATVPPTGTPAPPVYRRVGNYAVFVFGAPNEQAANQLIDQVKYEQVVQWLGENPFSYEKATREFTETTLGVFVSVVKTSGLALVSCLAIGGFFGALLFRFRRAQQRARDAFADSDAMLRLNLDELTTQRDPARLIGRRN